MIATAPTFRLVVRAAAPWAWRGDARTARKLAGFAATEAGSALDMLRAAELEPDARLRRLFFRHALDEARHARMFGERADRLAGGRARGSDYDAIHALRQNLYERLGPVRFVAFVHLAERRGLAHFEALARHFADQPALRALFETVGRDERFHVAYTAEVLDGWRRTGRSRAVRRALARVRFERAWDAWRRTGRRLGDALASALLGSTYFLVVSLFALLARALDRPDAGWTPAEPAPDSDDLRRLF